MLKKSMIFFFVLMEELRKGYLTFDGSKFLGSQYGCFFFSFLF